MICNHEILKFYSDIVHSIFPCFYVLCLTNIPTILQARLNKAIVETTKDMGESRRETVQTIKVNFQGWFIALKYS